MERSVEDRPIFKDLFEDVTTNFIFSHSRFADETTIILKGHLFVEYMLDMLIKKKVPKPALILKYNFSRKLDILYSLDLIPSHLYKNINHLNSLRNRLAHNLEFDLSLKKLTFYDTDGKTVNPRKDFYKLSIKTQARLWCQMILSQINYHYITNLKIAPIFT